MDKRTVLAIVLSVVVITIGFTIQSLLFTPEPLPEVQAQTEQTNGQNGTANQAVPAPDAPVGSAQNGAEASATGSGIFVPLGEDPLDIQPFTYSDNETYRISIDKRGATLTSFELIQHKEADGSPVNLVRPDGSDLPGLTTRFGGWDGQVMDALFFTSTGSVPGEFRFYRDFSQPGAEDSAFRITKIYTFKPGEYMFELEVQIQNLGAANSVPPINQDGKAYTVHFGPRIGPEPLENEAQLIGQQSSDFRRFTAYVDGSDRDYGNANPGVPQVLTERVNWAAIAGKYFSFVAVPGNATYNTIFSVELASDGTPGTQLALERGQIGSSLQTDTYRFYAGPMRSQDLARYNKAADNSFGISNLKLDDLVQTNILSWLEVVLKAGLQLFYFLIPNWGVAIILLTILVKFIFYPLTKKSHQSTKKLQMVQPKMKEIQEKLKDTPQKMNAAIAELYKKEGVNPLGGCLPMLIQLPFFFAMYGLFNNHFDLRGAEFIPGWITDLSAPDTVLRFGFEIPLLGWSELHILPFIYLASQLLYGKVAQQPQAGAQAGTAKLMMYALPIVFFFVLYNVPSGLLVYWIAQNLVTMGQQVWVNRHMNGAKK